MIVVAAKITTNPGKRDAFIKAAQPCIADTRREDGCLLYTLYASTDDENQLLYYERWTTREALRKHLESAHMRDFAKVKEEQGLVAGPSDVTIYEAAIID